jgi:hypothetical protein
MTSGRINRRWQAGRQAGTRERGSGDPSIHRAGATAPRARALPPIGAEGVVRDGSGGTPYGRTKLLLPRNRAAQQRTVSGGNASVPAFALCLSLARTYGGRHRRRRVRGSAFGTPYPHTDGRRCGVESVRYGELAPDSRNVRLRAMRGRWEPFIPNLRRIVRAGDKVA